jgi:8-oxo-dGTP diphosphatase
MTTKLREIHIAAALVVRADGQTLLVRKAGTTAFMQPGGKIEPGETAVAAFIRELAEEIGLVVTPADCQPLGRFTAIAAHEPDAIVIAETFIVRSDATASPAREIAQVAWVDPAAPGERELAALTRDHILPAWLARRSI